MEIVEKYVMRNRKKISILEKYFKGQEDKFKIVTKFIVK